MLQKHHPIGTTTPFFAKHVINHIFELHPFLVWSAPVVPVWRICALRFSCSAGCVDMVVVGFDGQSLPVVEPLDEPRHILRSFHRQVLCFTHIRSDVLYVWESTQTLRGCIYRRTSRQARTEKHCFGGGEWGGQGCKHMVSAVCSI